MLRLSITLVGAAPAPAPSDFWVEAARWTGYVIIALAIGALLVMTLVSLRSGGLIRTAIRPPRLERLEPRYGEDGFWLDTSYFAPGTTISYSCRSPIGDDVRQFVVQPSQEEQFVYTGEGVEAIRFLEASLPHRRRPFPLTD